MGSIEQVPSPASPENEIIVLVTGFGPFRSQYPINPSWEIAKALPPILPLSSQLPFSTTGSASNPSIRILLHPSPIRVNYTIVRDLVPKLWSSVPRIDYCVHVGMASGRDFYSVERRGHRDGYAMKDVDGCLLEDDRRKREEGKDWVWEGCPEEILTDVDIDDVWMRWRSALPDLDIRRSEDAGRYLCDFIYYSSLAYLWKRKEERRVVFFHVPVDSDQAAIQTGKDVLVELIRAVVQSETVKKVVGH